MGHNLKLSPFKEILKNTVVFYKANWKKIVFLFVPLEIVILFSLICLDLIPETDFFLATIGIVFFTIVSFIFSSFSKLLVLDAPRIIEKAVFGEGIPHVEVWYASMFRKIIPLSIVMFLVFVANFAFIFLVTMSAGVVFFLTSFLAKWLPQDSALAIVLVVATSVILLYAILRFVVRFFVSGSFSIYMYIFEDRKGLDAVTASFLLTDGRQFSLFWRMIGIWALSVIPFVVLVFPINAVVVIQSFTEVYQSFLMHQEPVLTNPGTPVSLLLNVFTSVASLLSVSFYIVFNYFLWKDVKATAGTFDEQKYIKTRKSLRSLVGAGVLIFVAILAATLVFDATYL